MAADERRDREAKEVGPKIVEVFDTWRVYASELEGSLEAKYHRDIIGDWIRGELTSRKLLVLINGLDADSWFWSKVRYDDERNKADAIADANEKVREKNRSELYANVH